MAILGDLEQQVMEVLWHAPGPRSVREVLGELTTRRDLAYTTVMTVLDRLAKKGIVEREREGRQWIYVPAQSRANLVADEVLELLGADEHERREVLTAVVQRLPLADRTWLTEGAGVR